MRADLTFAILLGGALEIDDRVLDLVRGARAIAADGGMIHARALGLTPELWVGDFDSADDALLARHGDVPRLPFAAAKDLTDGEIAVEQAIERGAQRLVMVGALAGERSDHALAHLFQAVDLGERGYDVVLTSGTEEAVPLRLEERVLDLPVGSLFSVIALGALTGLSLSGVKYPLEKADIPFAASRTISNVAMGAVTVSLESGRALLLARPHDLTGA
ncbi:thiamine diphosphokinase [Hoeflea sp.]|uniref:thiamine diphosphokinase n=1 Tax=Hoeflea sp. TaxID=1940281 RepID=UPI002AFFC9B7|nr:thiamine diphosphokinase [Hoeflea sp.]